MFAIIHSKLRDRERQRQRDRERERQRETETERQREMNEIRNQAEGTRETQS